jgi:hypothetical protein
MSEHARQLLAQVLALPDEDRRFVAEQLWAELGDDPWGDPEFVAEIERRSEAVHDGTADAKPWDQARDEIRAELARRAAARRAGEEPA